METLGVDRKVLGRRRLNIRTAGSEKHYPQQRGEEFPPLVITGRYSAVYSETCTEEGGDAAEITPGGPVSNDPSEAETNSGFTGCSLEGAGYPVEGALDVVACQIYKMVLAHVGEGNTSHASEVSVSAARNAARRVRRMEGGVKFVGNAVRDSCFGKFNGIYG